MAKTTFGRGGRTMAGPGSQDLARMLAGNGADPALIAKLHTNRPGVVNTFDPAVFQAAAATATANLEREAAERRAMAEEQMRRDQLAQQSAQANSRGRLDYAKANADNRLQTRAQGFREQQSQIDNKYRDRAFDATDARQQEELGLRRQNQFFQQDMTLEELEMQKRAADTGDQRHRDDFGLRERAANLNELSTLDAMRMREQAFGLEERRFGLAETQEDKRFSDGDRTSVEWKIQSAKAMEVESAEMLKAGRAMTLNAEGKREFAKLSEERRAILASKGDMTPDQFSQMMGKWTQKFADADIAGYEMQPPSIDERIAQGYRILPNDMAAFFQSDGTMQLLDGRSRGGAQVEAARIKAEAAGEPAPPVDPVQQWQQMYGGEKNNARFNKDYASAEERLKAEWMDNEENLDATPPLRMKSQEVIAEMQRMLDLQREFTAPPAAAAAPGAELVGNPAESVSLQSDTAGTAQNAGEMGLAEDWPPELTQEEEDAAWFAADPNRTKIRDLYDSQMTRGEKALPAFRDLTEALQGSKKFGLQGQHPAKYIHPNAIAELHSRGVKDPMSEAAASVAATIREGGKHFSLYHPYEQETMLQDVPIYDKQADAEKITQLPPGSYYMDPGLRLHRVPAIKATEKAATTVQNVASGIKAASDTIDDIFGKASAWMSSDSEAAAGTGDRVKRRGSQPANKPIPGRRASPGTNGR